MTDNTVHDFFWGYTPTDEEENKKSEKKQPLELSGEETHGSVKRFRPRQRISQAMNKLGVGKRLGNVMENALKVAQGIDVSKMLSIPSATAMNFDAANYRKKEQEAKLPLITLDDDENTSDEKPKSEASNAHVKKLQLVSGVKQNLNNLKQSAQNFWALSTADKIDTTIDKAHQFVWHLPEIAVSAGIGTALRLGFKAAAIEVLATSAPVAIPTAAIAVTATLIAGAGSGFFVGGGMNMYRTYKAQPQEGVAKDYDKAFWIGAKKGMVNGVISGVVGYTVLAPIVKLAQGSSAVMDYWTSLTSKADTALAAVPGAHTFANWTNTTTTLGRNDTVTLNGNGTSLQREALLGTPQKEGTGLFGDWTARDEMQAAMENNSSSAVVNKTVTTLANNTSAPSTIRIDTPAEMLGLTKSHPSITEYVSSKLQNTSGNSSFFTNLTGNVSKIVGNLTSVGNETVDNFNKTASTFKNMVVANATQGNNSSVEMVHNATQDSGFHTLQSAANNSSVNATLSQVPDVNSSNLSAVHNVTQGSGPHGVHSVTDNSTVTVTPKAPDCGTEVVKSGDALQSSGETANVVKKTASETLLPGTYLDADGKVHVSMEAAQHGHAAKACVTPDAEAIQEWHKNHPHRHHHSSMVADTSTDSNSGSNSGSSQKLEITPVAVATEETTNPATTTTVDTSATTTTETCDVPKEVTPKRTCDGGTCKVKCKTCNL